MSEWQDIIIIPDHPMAVLFYFGRMVFRDQSGDEVEFSSFRQERVTIGFWDGTDWCENGTGHDLFEEWRDPENEPTHWMALPPAPPLQLRKRRDEHQRHS